VVEGFITGLHKSPFHGFSVEFAEHRIYNKGESTRHIDWKLFGRTEKLFTKKYEEETNLRCQIIIDDSSSMYFPKDEGISKFEFSVYAAASLIELLKKQRDAVGLSLISDKIELHTQAKSSIVHHRFLYSELEKRMISYDPNQRKTTNIVQSLHDIAELTHRRSLIIVFSDLLDDPDKVDELFRALEHMRHNKHEVILFHVVDGKKEIDFELGNRPFNLVDMETGERMKIRPAEVKESYKKAVNTYFEELKMRSINNRIDFMPADIHEGYNQILLQYFLKRQKMY
jgi:uncharacterized protein (DUF58 family)